MPKKKKRRIVDLMRQSRSRENVIKPVTKIIPNYKAKRNKEACRSKVGEE